MTADAVVSLRGPSKYAPLALPLNGELALRLVHCDVVRDRDELAARFKVALQPTGEERRFQERWDVARDALIAGGIVDRDALPVIDESKLDGVRSYVAIPLRFVAVTMTVRTSVGGRQIAFATRTLTKPVPQRVDARTTADDLAGAVDAGVAAVKPVLEKHGLALDAGDAIEIGRAVLEQQRRRA